LLQQTLKALAVVEVDCVQFPALLSIHRNMSGNRRVSGAGTMASSLLAVDRIIQKENYYREGIAKNHAASKMLADMLAIDGGGELSKSVQDAADPSTKQEIEAAINEQRERLQKISEKNVMNSRNVDAFMGALSAVRNQVQATPETDEQLDYERIIQDKMQQYSAANAGSQVDVRDEKFCREIRSSLGIKERASKKDDDSDEELEVLRNPAGTQSLKCPITAMLYEEPLRNKVCGHVYSKAGIMQMLRSHQPKCPVVGCRNGAVTMSQLEEDVETEMKVKRQRRREETERQQRASQAIYDSDDDDVL
jgi:SUMO ligase MMS21 Smc5/6 complex component